MQCFSVIFLFGFAVAAATISVKFNQEHATKNTSSSAAAVAADHPSKYAMKCEYPNMVLLRVRLNNGQVKFCTGILVSLVNVVSGAECISRHAQSIEVLLGGSTLGEMKLKILVNRSGIHIHPRFKKASENSQLPVNNVAFITLPKRLKENKCIQPIRMANRDDRFYSLCKIAGWKKTREGKIEKRLQLGTVKIIKTGKCRVFVPDVDGQEICGKTSEKRNNTCQGDIGLALMCTRISDNHLVLVGVSSSDVGCSSGVKVFTDLSHFLSYDEHDFHKKKNKHKRNKHTKAGVDDDDDDEEYDNDDD